MSTETPSLLTSVEVRSYGGDRSYITGHRSEEFLHLYADGGYCLSRYCAGRNAEETIQAQYGKCDARTIESVLQFARNRGATIIDRREEVK